jgi:enamine deaminase RidA (YjgF/YER057c/UK114 family)
MTVQRMETGPRMSQIVVHGNTVYLAGVVANEPANKSVAQQTKDILDTIDSYLAKAGTDKNNILSAQIFLADISSFADMNSEWDKWVAKGNTPARATIEANLAAPAYKVEIMVTAAK